MSEDFETLFVSFTFINFNSPREQRPALDNDIYRENALCKGFEMIMT